VIVADAPAILVCFAVKEEAQCFAARSAKVVLTGMGRENARRAAREALDRVRPGLVLTCGFAGGLDPALAVGTVIFSADDAGLTSALLAAGARPARFHCAARVAVTAAEKRDLRAQTGADAVEMESEAIRDLCHERGVPSATVRVISDAADEDLPLDFNALMTPEQKLCAGRLTLALLRAPWKVPALLRLRRDTTLAARRLAEALDTVIAPRQAAAARPAASAAAGIS
jgi:nucleoside phosphorylase